MMLHHCSLFILMVVYVVSRTVASKNVPVLTPEPGTMLNYVTKENYDCR